jgi:hypothetical protein
VGGERIPTREKVGGEREEEIPRRARGRNRRCVEGENPKIGGINTEDLKAGELIPRWMVEDGEGPKTCTEEGIRGGGDWARRGRERWGIYYQPIQ